MLWSKIDFNARCKAKGINNDQESQQTFNTENQWLNIIVTHLELKWDPLFYLLDNFLIIFSSNIEATDKLPVEKQHVYFMSTHLNEVEASFSLIQIH